MPEKSMENDSVKNTANLGRSIRRNGRLVGTRTPDLHRVKVYVYIVVYAMMHPWNLSRYTQRCT